MNAVVCMKEVLDIRVPIYADKGRILQQGPAPVYVPNPRDLAALEEAMHLKERFGSTVTAISLGAQQTEDVLYYSLARGADRAIRLARPSPGDIDPLSETALLGNLISRFWQSDYIVFCGDKSQDEGTGCFVPFLADSLRCPQVTRTVRIDADPGKGSALVCRQVENGWCEEVECSLPAVIGVERSSRESRYVSTFAWENAVQQGRVERIDTGPVAAAQQPAAWLRLVEAGSPKPRTKKSFVPDSNLSPEERLRLLISGMAAPKQEDDFIDGTPEVVAGRIVEFLKDKGFIRSEGDAAESST